MMQHHERDVGATTADGTVYQSAGAQDTSTAKQVAQGAASAAGTAAGDVAQTAKEQVRNVAGEASTQARNVASQMRQRVTDEAHTQNDRLAGVLRKLADEFEEMTRERGDSPAQAVVSRLASSGRQAADYLADRGPDGVLNEVTDFARRRPGAFLLTAAVTGFVVGRLGKGVLGASSDSGSSTTATPAYGTAETYSTPTYATAADTYPTTASTYPTTPAETYPATAGTYTDPTLAPGTTTAPTAPGTYSPGYPQTAVDNDADAWSGRP